MGLEPDDAITSAELYDPEGATWSATGNMVKPHAGFPATLLRDGRVLVGDLSTSLTWATAGPGPSAEVYDPASGTWSATGNMVADRGGNAEGTLLRDGRVLVTGRLRRRTLRPRQRDLDHHGEDDRTAGPARGRPASRRQRARGERRPSPAPPVELYDPATGTWSAGADMHESYMGVSATLLGNGNVLVLGGQFNGPISAELYDPASGTRTVVEEFPEVSTTGATLLSDGRVLLPGPDGFRLYDPDSGTWTAAASPEHGGDATLLLDGRVLVVGPEASELYIPAARDRPCYGAAYHSSGSWALLRVPRSPSGGASTPQLPEERACTPLPGLRTNPSAGSRPRLNRTARQSAGAWRHQRP